MQTAEERLHDGDGVVHPKACLLFWYMLKSM